jgi:hypothetical protein
MTEWNLTIKMVSSSCKTSYNRAEAKFSTITYNWLHYRHYFAKYICWWISPKLILILPCWITDRCMLSRCRTLSVLFISFQISQSFSHISDCSNVWMYTYANVFKRYAAFRIQNCFILTSDTETLRNYIEIYDVANICCLIILLGRIMETWHKKRSYYKTVYCYNYKPHLSFHVVIILSRVHNKRILQEE